MPILEIDGVGRVEVDDTFTKLSADQQNAYVNSVMASVKSGAKEGMGLLSNPLGAFEGLGSSFQKGVANTITGKGQTAEELGAPNLGAAIKGTGQAFTPNVEDAATRFNKPLPGDTTIGGKSLNAVPRLVAEGAGGFVGELPARSAGATVGAMVGGVPGAAVGALLGPAVSGAASTFGPELDARRQNNNGQLGPQDYAIAAGSAALQGALNAVGMGSVRAPAKLAENTIAGSAKRVGTAGAVEGATSAAQGVTSELAQNVGTQNGQVSGQSLMDAAITSGVQGVGTGGLIRGGSEVASIPRVIAAERAIRAYDHRDLIPEMSSEYQRIAQENNLNIANKADAKKVQDIFDANIKKHKDTADNAVEVELNKQVKEGTLTTADRDKALAALKVPNKEGFDILQSRVGNEPFGANAMKLAKVAANARQARAFSGLDKPSATEVTGPLDSLQSKALGAATGAAAGAILPTTFMSSIQGSGVLASIAAAGHVAPMVVGGIAAYMGLRKLNKALGTDNPIQQLVEGGAKKGVSFNLPGSDMESPRALKEAEETQRMQAQADALKQARFTNLNLRNDALAQQLQLRPTVVQAQNAQREASAAKTQAQAEAIPILAKANAELTQARAENVTSKTELNRIRAEIETLKKQKLAATDKADKDAIGEQIKNLKKAVGEAQAQKKAGPGVLSGQTESADLGVDPKVEKAIAGKANTVLSFEKVFRQKAPDEVDAVMPLLDDLRLRVNNFEDGYAAVTEAAKASKNGEFIMNWWVKPGAAPKDTRLGRLFSYRDGNKVGVIMTKAEAEARRFGDTPIAAE